MAVAACALVAAPAAQSSSRAPSEENTAYSGARVANFVAAERLDGGHPPVRLSFWSGPGGKIIEYAPGDGNDIITLRPVGSTPDGTGFRAKATDGSIWFITPTQGVLLVENGNGTSRIFMWQYQGPVNGQGTACMPCVPETDAIVFVQDEFLGSLP